MQTSYSITNWQEETYQDLAGQGKLTQAKVSKTYTGRMQGTGEMTYLMAYHPNGTVDFTGVEYFSGSIDGKSGTLVLREQGQFEQGNARAEFEVLAGSASEQLVGVSGGGGYQAGEGKSVALNLTVDFA